MSLFDLGAGLILLVSVAIGWFRGGTREVATVAALIIAAIVALFALRFSGPIARHAIHTPWLANVVAILIVFVAVYILLRVAASALTRRIQQTTVLGNLDRMLGAGFGLIRALVILGLANLTINAITPPERMPTWISGAFLYPVTAGAADVLKAFAPQGEKLVGQVVPVVGHAVSNGADDNSTQAPPSQNRDYNAPSNAPRGNASPRNAPGPRVETTQ
jgi:membrane protein required for colicin V production